ncbi:MAG: M48 family metallopeptidase [Candidatus Eremiobacteraeota bacterium]|nr:M48 family metallopeptidase [Candidatus Eremiobacteraeota bacterium]
MKKLQRRGIALALLASLVVSNIPLPAGAVSTSTEIRIGQQASAQVDRENPVLSDPILNNWVNSIAVNLAQYRARPDINYTFKVLDTNDINAFSLPGGFVYLNYGLLNFVNSDDELAGVMGHEMGHVERRHQITLNAKAQIVNVILGILAMASPFVYRFGSLINSLSVYKMSRVDELQADQYGLLLMSRAGYDPDGMVSFMERLGQKGGPNSNLLNKYFETHPEAPARISHLRGYPELTNRVPAVLLAQAIHDESEGRYAYAHYKLGLVLAKDPNNQLALLHTGQVDLALGNFNESQQALVKVAHANGASSAAESAAVHELALLPKAQTPGGKLLNPNIAPLIEQVSSVIAGTKATQTTLDASIKLGKDDVTRFNARLDSLSYEVPNFSNINVRPGSRIDGVISDLSHMAKDINIVFNKTSALMANSPGMLMDDVSVLNEMQAPLHRKTMRATDLELLPFYPDLLKQMNASQSELVSGVTAARGSVALGYQALAPLDAYFRQLDRAQLDFGGDLSPRTAQDLKPLAQTAIVALDAAANAAETAQTFYFNAQARQLIGAITMLGVGVSQGRYDTLTRVMQQRLGVAPPTYEESVRLGLSAGDITAATWLAAEEKVPVSTVINEQRATGKTIIDMAVDKHLSQESLEVIMGLIYEGYAEKPLD